MKKENEKVLTSEEVVYEVETREKQSLTFKDIKDKLLNFRLLSLLICIGGLLSIFLSILFLSFFQNARMFMGKEADYTGLAVNDDQIIGFVMFIFSITALVIGVINVYTSLPFIFNKEKLSPKKSHGWLSLTGGILDLLIAIFSILNLALRPNTPVGFWVTTLIFGLLFALYSGALLLPCLNVKVYQPKPEVKK